MPKYIIEREIAGVGESPEAALQAVSQTSCNVLRELGYAAADKAMIDPTTAEA